MERHFRKRNCAAYGPYTKPDMQYNDSTSISPNRASATNTTAAIVRVRCTTQPTAGIVHMMYALTDACCAAGVNGEPSTVVAFREPLQIQSDYEVVQTSERSTTP